MEIHPTEELLEEPRTAAEVLADRIWLPVNEPARDNDDPVPESDRVVLHCQPDERVIVGPSGRVQLSPGAVTGIFSVLLHTQGRVSVSATDLAQLGFRNGDSNEVGKVLKQLDGQLERACGRQVLETVALDGRTKGRRLYSGLTAVPESGTDTGSPLPEPASVAIESVSAKVSQWRPAPQTVRRAERSRLRGIISERIDGRRLLGASCLNDALEVNEAERDSAVHITIAAPDTIIIGRYAIPLRMPAQRFAFNALMRYGRIQPLPIDLVRKMGEPDQRLYPTPALNNGIRQLIAMTALANGGMPIIHRIDREKLRPSYDADRALIFHDGGLVGDELDIVMWSKKARILAPAHALGREALMLDGLPAGFFAGDQATIQGMYETGVQPNALTIRSLQQLGLVGDHGLLTEDGERILAQVIEAGLLAQMKRARLIADGRTDNAELLADLAELEMFGANAKKMLIGANLRLVAWWARCLTIELPHVKYSDVVQAGVGGLIKAVEMYDFTRERRFASYAKHWIRKRIFETIHSELAADTPVEIDHERALPHLDTPERQLIQSEMRSMIHLALADVLTDDERQTVEVVFGLNGGPGDGDGYESAAGRDCIDAVLAKLSASSHAAGLREYLDIG